MNREELEKIFDEKYFIFTERQKQDMKDFWFKNIIPEVLKNIMPGEDINTAYFFTKDGVKQKAKELYNIDL